ncbi:hypothetical protein TRVL_10122 [Trypanosoma vivax]|nr:hypothetical protein TRVL_10122 [Trypanosoma vivax]
MRLIASCLCERAAFFSLTVCASTLDLLCCVAALFAHAHPFASFSLHSNVRKSGALQRKGDVVSKRQEVSASCAQLVLNAFCDSVCCRACILVLRPGGARVLQVCTVS